MLQRLIYLSTKTESYKGHKTILEQSVKNNGARGISGILLEYENNFIQYLEGDPIEVYSLFKRIEQDDRHKDIWLVDYSPVSSRAFSNWGMGFKKLNNTELKAWGIESLGSQISADSLQERPELLQLIQMIEFSGIKSD